MPVIKSTATTQLLIRKKKKKNAAVDKTEAEKTRVKSIKRSLSGKVKDR
ncbi:MAG TPA: hypothetical protein PK605_12240 [Ignavibacteria bacterium]|nr:hypothetical protein [Ignavibacteria bacterium]HRJ05161.1 hypothetical protein [Ignavibacteria bacterium]HRJ86925.1 hypothetical protein [Ignavibacteria bacterium]